MKGRLDSSEIVVGLDIGTTKVSAVVGEVDADGITILGVGNVPCRGLRKGVVSNIDWTVRSIRDAIEAAQTMAGVEIRTVYAGVAGSHIRCQASDGVAAIAGGEVTRADVERVLEGARAIPVDADRQILHVLPREYIVDNQDGIRDPIGMSGVRLGAKVNLVTAATSCVQNVIRCAERCGLVVADVVLEPLASAEAVLSEDEKEIGVAVIDIGGGTTDLLLYVDGGIAHASVIPVGGNNVTNDIAAGLRTPMGEAERLKRNSGCALGRMVGDDEEIEVPGVGGHAPRKAARRVLSDIIEPRVEEIFAVVRKRIEDTGLLEQLSAGVGAHRRRRAARGHDRVRRGDPRHAGSHRLPGGRARHHAARARARSTRPASASCSTARTRSPRRASARAAGSRRDSHDARRRAASRREDARPRRATGGAAEVAVEAAGSGFEGRFLNVTSHLATSSTAVQTRSTGR